MRKFPKWPKYFKCHYEEVVRNLGVKTRAIAEDLKISGWVDKDLNVHYGQPKGPQAAPNPAKRGAISKF